MKIYVDQDGVLSDFDKEFQKLGHGSADDFVEKYSENAMWHLINSKVDNFWKYMEWMPDGKDFWNFVKDHNPTILTKPAPVKHCKEDKLAWLKKEIGDVPVIVTTKKEKYADKDSVLIDDMPKNISKWQEAGGIGILHTSAENSIKKLQKILSKKSSFVGLRNIEALLKYSTNYPGVHLLDFNKENQHHMEVFDSIGGFLYPAVWETDPRTDYKYYIAYTDRGDQKKPIGIVGYFKSKDGRYCTNIGVVPGQRRKGWGEFLYKELKDKISKKGLSDLYAVVDINNLPSKKFHEYIGKRLPEKDQTYLDKYKKILFKLPF
ncbi:MAG TPA: GNAT family N-acetyltransferase [Methanofastidiosum sp.]|nr:GNAT family N-acetyltransferase [Methanofastidiosum sp.]